MLAMTVIQQLTAKTQPGDDQKDLTAIQRNAVGRRVSLGLILILSKDRSQDVRNNTGSALMGNQDKGGGDDNSKNQCSDHLSHKKN